MVYTVMRQGATLATLTGVTHGRETEEVCHAPLGPGAGQWPLASSIAADDMTTRHNPGSSIPGRSLGLK